MPSYPGFIGSDYQSSSYMADNERCVNFFVEGNESTGAATPSCLLGTPGFAIKSTVTDSPGRGSFIVQGRGFFVAGPTLYELNLATYATINRGTVAQDQNPVTFCSNGNVGNQLGLTSGTNFYVLNLVTNVLTRILTGTATMCDFLDGFALVLDAATSTLAISTEDDFSTFDPTQTVQPTAAQDWIAMKVCNRLIYLIGRTAGEVWWNAGSAPFPFQPIQEAFMQQGIGAQFSIALLETDGPACLLWVTQNAQGHGEIVRTNGYVPGRVSTHGIENAIQNYSTITDAIAAGYQQNGHPFYVVTFPIGQQTFVFDLSTNVWHERAFWNTTLGIYQASRALWFLASGTNVLAFDIRLGVVYLMSLGLYSDVDGSVIRRMRQPPRLSVNQRRFNVKKLQILMDVGLGTASGQGLNPVVMLECSRDGGQTFGPELDASAGAGGAFDTRVWWGPLGQATQFVPRFTMTDPVPWRLVDCTIDVVVGLS